MDENKKTTTRTRKKASATALETQNEQQLARTPASPKPTKPPAPVNPAQGQVALMPEVTNLVARVTRDRPGAPTIRTDEMIDEIVMKIACGWSLVAVCQLDHMPAYPTVQRWRMNDPEFAAMLRVAYEAHADTYDDIVEDILAGGPSSTDDFRRDEARVAHIRWRLGKLNNRFKDKVQVDHTVSNVFVMEQGIIDMDEQ